MQKVWISANYVEKQYIFHFRENFRDNCRQILQGNCRKERKWLFAKTSVKCENEHFRFNPGQLLYLFENEFEFAAPNVSKFGFRVINDKWKQRSHDFKLFFQKVRFISTYTLACCEDTKEGI
jgi:hypothetical protein